MGGCATKPKESKGEVAAEAPAPAPAPEKEEAAVVVVGSEEWKKFDGDGDAVVDKDKEIVDDDTVDEHGSKRRSLSHLFKENAGKESTEHDNTQSDPVKQEVPPLNQNPTDVSKRKSRKFGKTETSIEQTLRDVVEAPIVKKEVEVATAATGTLAEKATEPPATTETQKTEEEKTIVEDKPAAETQKTETTNEKKAAEEKSSYNE